MNSTGSILKTVIDRIRTLCDAAQSDRYLDTEILEQFVLPSYVSFWNDICMGSQDEILLSMTVSLVEGTDRYLLPPSIGSVEALVKFNDDGLRTHDWQPRGNWHPFGTGWRIEANELVFEPSIAEDEDWVLIYRPSGDFLPHYALDGAVVSSTVIQLSADPELGTLDHRPSAYTGAFLRILESGRVIQERVISSYDAATRRATVRLPFTQDANHLPANGATGLTYEVAFRLYQPMIQAISAMAAMEMGSGAEFSVAKMQKLEHTYLRHQKASRDHFYNLLARHAKRTERLTYDNPYLDGEDGPVILGGR